MTDWTQYFYPTVEKCTEGIKRWETKAKKWQECDPEKTLGGQKMIDSMVNLSLDQVQKLMAHRAALFNSKL